MSPNIAVVEALEGRQLLAAYSIQSLDIPADRPTSADINSHEQVVGFWSGGDLHVYGWSAQTGKLDLGSLPYPETDDAFVRIDEDGEVIAAVVDADGVSHFFSGHPFADPAHPFLSVDPAIQNVESGEH